MELMELWMARKLLRSLYTGPGLNLPMRLQLFDDTRFAGQFLRRFGRARERLRQLFWRARELWRVKR